MNIVKFLKKFSLPCFLIVLGSLIFYWTKDYKGVPSGLGPDIFPRIVATLMIVLSVISIILDWKKDIVGEFTPNRAAIIKMIITVTALIALVLLMKYVHVVLGIALFLAFYLHWIADLPWKKTLIISVIGTVVLYLVILTLRIPL